jgi:hypothetical protein
MTDRHKRPRGRPQSPPPRLGPFFLWTPPSLDVGIQYSLKNHEGNGAQIVGEARPSRWRLKEVAN